MMRYTPVAEYRMGSVFAGMDKDSEGEWVRHRDAEHYRNELLILTHVAYVLLPVAGLISREPELLLQAFESNDDATEFISAIEHFQSVMTGFEARQWEEDRTENQILWEHGVMQEVGILGRDGHA